MKKKKKRKRHTRQSIAKNVALLFLSLGLLAGASMLFTSVSSRSDLSLDPIQSTWKGLVSREDKPSKPIPAEKETKESSVTSFDYSFYKILRQKNGPAQTDEHYSIQISSFKSQDRARSLARELREKSRIKCRVDKEGTFFCVRWGTFTTVQSAEENRIKLSQKLNRDCRVVKM
jgi:cell division septation protein DedD